MLDEVGWGRDAVRKKQSSPATPSPETLLHGKPRRTRRWRWAGPQVWSSHPLSGGCWGDPRPLCTPAPFSHLTCWHDVCLPVSSGGMGPSCVSVPGL